MRPLARQPPGSRRLTVLFAVVLFPPALALVWLGATLFDQDQAMLAQRGRERQEAAAEIVTHSLAKSLSDAERWLVDDDLPEGTVRLTRRPDQLDVTPTGRAAHKRFSDLDVGDVREGGRASEGVDLVRYHIGCYAGSDDHQGPGPRRPTRPGRAHEPTRGD
jgi:hypothetical protein